MAHVVAAIVHDDPGGDAIVFGLPRRGRLRPPLSPMIASILSLINHSSVRYLAVGALNTTVGYGVIYAAMYFADVAPAAANALGYGVGLVVSYTLNRRWTFRSDAAVLGSAVRFLAVMGAAYLANLATVVGLIDRAGVDPYVAQAAGLFPYLAIGYAGSRFVAFRSARC